MTRYYKILLAVVEGGEGNKMLRPDKLVRVAVELCVDIPVLKASQCAAVPHVSSRGQFHIKAR